MGFISSLFEIHHRAVGMRAKELCTDTSSSNEEFQVINNFQLNSNDFIPYRNALLVMMFNLFYLMSIKQTENNPEATFDISQNFFQKMIFEYCESLTEPSKSNMMCVFSAAATYINIEEAPTWLYEKTSGKKFIELDANEQNIFTNFVNNYIDRVALFFKKESSKLLK